MAETQPGAREPGGHEQSYPDPISSQPGPYPVLASPGSSAVPQQNGHASSVPTPQAQYQMLANGLPAQIANGSSEHADLDAGPEGLPMANRYLNLNPLADDWPDDSQAEETDIDGFETADETTPRESTRGRGRGRPRGRGGTRRGWKWALKGTEHDPKLNREPKQRGRPRGPGAPRGRRKKTLDPGRDFKENQTKATKALLDGNFEEALDFARAAVQANPEIWAAHSLLAEALESLGRPEDSLAALLSGAVVARDAATWMLVAERTLHFAGDSRSEDVLQQAVFCYSQAIDLEKAPDRNLPARIAKLDLWVELGEFMKARRDCKVLLAIIPGDIELARQFADLSAMTGDVFEISAARKAYEIAMESTYPHASGVAENELDEAWNHLNILMELVDREMPPPEAIQLLKRWSRRLLGRAHEQYWELYRDDDREFDLDEERRQDVEQYLTSSDHDPLRYGEGLPLELRVKLGLFRLKTATAHRQEAMHHLSSLLMYKEDIATLSDMFYLVATSLQNKGEYMTAMEYFEPILQIVDEVTDDFWLQYGKCLVGAKRYREAADCFEQAIKLNADHIDARVELARLLQTELKNPDRAVQLVNEVISLNRKELLQRESLVGTANAFGKRAREDAVNGESDVDDVTAGGADGSQKRRRTQQRSADADLLDDRQNLTPAQIKKAEVKARRAAKRALQTEDDERARQQKLKSRAALRDAKIRSRAKMESMADQLVDQFNVVRRTWDAAENGDEAALEEWTEAAISLYESFRGVKHFYPARDKHVKFRGFERLATGEAQFMNQMESWRKELQVQQTGRTAGIDKDFGELYSVPSAPDDNLPKDFCGIPFTDWHHLFVDLALQYARKGDQAACYEVVDDGLYGANVFYHDGNMLNTTQATSLSCAFIFNDSERLCFAARWFINKADYCHGAAFQLFSAVNRLSYGGNMWYSAGPTQKHMLRTIKALDHHAFDPKTRAKFDWGMQGPGLKNRLARVGTAQGHLDANALLTYGHMVGVANHSQSALPYFFRAFALQPENATVILSIAVMYIQNAMKRQTDNRHYGIMQGLSFLQRYQEVRGASEEVSIQQEVAFNTGRLWHMLGLTHLAVSAYEKAMDMSDAVQQEFAERNPDAGYAAEDYAQEAALAMVNILAIAGNDRAAEQIVSRYLVM